MTLRRILSDFFLSLTLHDSNKNPFNYERKVLEAGNTRQDATLSMANLGFRRP